MSKAPCTSAGASKRSCGIIEPLESRVAPAALVTAFQVAASGHAGDHTVETTDAQGDVIVVGKFFKSIVPAPGATPLTTTDPAGDIYIAKYSPTGALVWANTWGGLGPEYPNAVTTDANGDVFVTGGFSSTQAGYGGTGEVSALGHEDVFLLKLDGRTGGPASSFSGPGELTWGGQDKGTGQTEAGYSVAVNQSGNVVVSGIFSSSAPGYDGSSGTANYQGGTDAFAFLVNGGSGAPVPGFGTSGVITLGTPNNDGFYQVAVDSANDLYFYYQDNAGPGGKAQDNVVKVSGSTGALVSTFGSGGIKTYTPPPNSPPVQAAALALDNAGSLIIAVSNGANIRLGEFDSSTGLVQSSFGTKGEVILPESSIGAIDLNADASNQITITGNNASGAFITSVNATGTSTHTESLPGVTVFSSSIDFSGILVLRGLYSGNPNLDPTGGSFHLPAVQLGAGMEEGIVERIDPLAFNSATPLFFLGANGDTTEVKLTGPGGFTMASGSTQPLTEIDLFNTTLASRLSIELTGPGNGPAAIDRIETQSPIQNVGSITLGPNLVLGSGAVDTEPALHVSGQLNSLTLGDINQNAVIEIGNGLPYSTPHHATPDTFTNHPKLTIGDILGAGVEIDVLGDGTTGGVGGGGLGNVLIHSWDFPGLLQTTQSIGNFTVQQEDFLGVLKIGTLNPAPFLLFASPMHKAAAGGAGAGNMTIQNGAWGSSGSVIQGNIESFDANAFLAGATLTAGSVGVVTVTSGSFAGTLTLTEGGAAAAKTFTVNSNFTGSVVSAQPLKKINVKGDFTGSLQAPGIASITAYAFLGTAPANPGDPYLNTIKVTQGVLGNIKSTAGIIENFKLTTPDVFSGISVNVGNLTEDATGIENVDIEAAAIGNISVRLAASKFASNIHLTGIDDSTFTTTNSGTTKGSIGSIGNIAVTIAGNSGVVQATGINDSSFDSRAPLATVNPVGKIHVKLTGAAGASVGLSGADFEGNSVGSTALSITPGAGGTAVAVNGATYLADHAMGGISITGDFTSAAADSLEVWAGGAIGPIVIKSKTAPNGSLVDSSILAGQSLSFPVGLDEKMALQLLNASALGSVTLSGSLSTATLAAGSNIGVVNIGGNVDASQILAGSLLGSDHLFGGGDDSFQRAAKIGSVTVKGTFTASSIAAGIDPVSGAFGDGDDKLGALAGPLTTSSSIGVVSIGGDALVTSSAPTHQYAIEAATIKKLILPQAAPITDFTTTVLIDVNGSGEGATNVLVNQVTE